MVLYVSRVLIEEERNSYRALGKQGTEERIGFLVFEVFGIHVKCGGSE